MRYARQRSEAYYWLRHNTKPDAKVMSWWDYGYQITAMVRPGGGGEEWGPI